MQIMKIPITVPLIRAKKESNEESDDSTSKASSKTGKDFEIVEKNTVDTADEEPDQP